MCNEEGIKNSEEFMNKIYLKAGKVDMIAYKERFL